MPIGMRSRLPTGSGQKVSPGCCGRLGKEENLRCRAMGSANSPLALQCGVNFKILKFEHRISPPPLEDLKTLERKDPFPAKMFFQLGRNIIAFPRFESYRR